MRPKSLPMYARELTGGNQPTQAPVTPTDIQGDGSYRHDGQNIIHFDYELPTEDNSPHCGIVLPDIGDGLKETDTSSQPPPTGVDSTLPSERNGSQRRLFPPGTSNGVNVTHTTSQFPPTQPQRAVPSEIPHPRDTSSRSSSTGVGPMLPSEGNGSQCGLFLCDASSGVDVTHAPPQSPPAQPHTQVQFFSISRRIERLRICQDCWFCQRRQNYGFRQLTGTTVRPAS